jgi:hypothetical protein
MLLCLVVGLASAAPLAESGGGSGGKIDDAGGNDRPSASAVPDEEERFLRHVPLVTLATVALQRVEKHLLILFDAPWCGAACRAVKPTYATVAVAFAAESAVLSVVTVEVAAPEEKLAAEANFGVDSFPTVLLLARQAGGKSKVVTYTGDRSLSDLVKFVNGKLGLERLATGRLSDQAGTFVELNDRVEEWKAKKRSLAALAASLPADSYYHRVVEGIQKQQQQQGQGGNAAEVVPYVVHETQRLAKLYQGGTGAMRPEQLDSLQRRLNVLEVFADNDEDDED